MWRSQISEQCKVSRRRSVTSGRMLINQYRRLSKLGRGTFGEVFKVEDSATGELFALKVKEARACKQIHVYTCPSVKRFKGKGVG